MTTTPNLRNPDRVSLITGGEGPGAAGSPQTGGRAPRVRACDRGGFSGPARPGVRGGTRAWEPHLKTLFACVRLVLGVGASCRVGVLAHTGVAPCVLGEVPGGSEVHDSDGGDSAAALFDDLNLLSPFSTQTSDPSLREPTQGGPGQRPGS